MVLICCVLVPLIDLAAVPIRWMLAQQLVNVYARKLSLCETFSGARAMMEADPSLSTRLHRLGGVDVQSINLHLRISRVQIYAHQEEFLLAETPKEIPQTWLPNGAKAPCSYLLELDVKSLMSPLILLPFRGISIPGLTRPIPLVVSGSHEWGNLGPDPLTGKFFLNE